MTDRPTCEADFYYFKPEGKWKYDGRGLFPDWYLLGDDLRQEILTLNHGRWPGLISSSLYPGLTIVIIPIEPNNTGYPRMLMEPT